MAKIGRNEPCPCGSGKKYKKCCLNKPKPEASTTVRNLHWSVDEIREMKTQAIISKLTALGVPFDEEQFLQDVANFGSAQEMADHWHDIYPVAAEGFDEDFIWMGIEVLWERLTPDVINSERLNNMIQDGYSLVGRGGRLGDGCDLWLEVWDHLKSRITEDMTDIDDAEQVFEVEGFLFNWCQDLEEELHNAGFDNPEYFQKRIDYCREFCSLFPDSDHSIITNMRRAEAESCFLAGKKEEGEQAFEALIRDFPDYVWGYIGWGDMYSIFSPSETDKDISKARKIYEMGLNIDSDEKKHLLDRIESLEHV